MGRQKYENLQEHYNALSFEHEALKCEYRSLRDDTIAAQTALQQFEESKHKALAQLLEEHRGLQHRYEALRQQLEGSKPGPVPKEFQSSQAADSPSYSSLSHSALKQEFESVKQENELLRLNAVGSVPLKEHSALKELYEALKQE